MPNDRLNIGDFRQQVAGNVEWSGAGDHFTIYATGAHALLSLRAMGSVVVGAGGALLTLDNDSPTGGLVYLQGGPTGAMKLGVGLPGIGAEVCLEPAAITLSVGPAGAGASLKMTPTSIVFQVAETSYEMTPLGIVEKNAVAQRELALTGHKLTAAETELDVALPGVSWSGPMVQGSADAVTDMSETLGNYATDAIRKQQDGMLMLT